MISLSFQVSNREQTQYLLSRIGGSLYFTQRSACKEHADGNRINMLCTRIRLTLYRNLLGLYASSYVKRVSVLLLFFICFDHNIML